MDIFIFHDLTIDQTNGNTAISDPSKSTIKSQFYFFMKNYYQIGVKKINIIVCNNNATNTNYDNINNKKNSKKSNIKNTKKEETDKDPIHKYENASAIAIEKRDPR